MINKVWLGKGLLLIVLTLIISLSADKAPYPVNAGTLISSYNILKNDPVNQQFIQKLKANGSSDEQIESFLIDLDSQVQKAGSITETNFDSVMYKSLKEIISWPKHSTVYEALLNGFGEEIDYTLTNKQLHPNLVPLRNAVRESVLGKSVSSGSNLVGGGGPAQTQTSSDMADEIKRQLAISGSNPVNLVLSQDSGNITITADLLQQIISAGRDLCIKNDYITVRLKAGTLKPDMNGISFSIWPLKDKAAEGVLKNLASGLKLVGKICEITCTATADGGQTSVRFQQPIILAFSYTEDSLSSTTDSEPDVYYFNESSGQWERMHGVIDRTARTISFSSSHLSKYAIMSLTAQKSDKASQEKVIIQSTAKFTDLDGHWAAADIESMVQLGLVGGVGNNMFAPDRKITRAEFTVLLANALGIKQGTPAHDHYSDVTFTQWYFGVVNAAADAGLVGGISASRFGPDQYITREQMAVMINNALTYKNQNDTLDTLSAASNLEVFYDQCNISAWARLGVARIVQKGIVCGRGNGLFAPSDYATRAEAAIMILKMYKQM